MPFVEIGVLLLKVGAGVIFLLTGYRALILRPQIRFLKVKITLPEYQGTAHQKTMIFSLGHLEKVSNRLGRVILLMGILWLGVFPFLLR